MTCDWDISILWDQDTRHIYMSWSQGVHSAGINEVINNPLNPEYSFWYQLNWRWGFHIQYGRVCFTNFTQILSFNFARFLEDCCRKFVGNKDFLAAYVVISTLTVNVLRRLQSTAFVTMFLVVIVTKNVKRKAGDWNLGCTGIHSTNCFQNLKPGSS